MKVFLIFVLISTVGLTLCGCYTPASLVRPVHLAEKYRDQKVDVAVMYVYDDRVGMPYIEAHPERYYTDFTSAQVISALSREAPESRAKGYDFESNVLKPTVKAIENSPSYQLESIKIIDRETDRIRVEISQNIKQKHVAYVSYYFSMPTGTELKSSLSFELYERDDSIQHFSDLHRFHITETYDISSLETFDGSLESSYRKSIKEAITITTQKIVERLKRHMADPYDVKAVN